MSTTTLAPPAGRRTVLDDAHVGDIHGALGTIRSHHAPPLGGRRRLLALLAIMGPGLIVMVGDNDAGGRRDLRPGGPELRADAGVGAGVADPGADRQPGDGRPARRGHGRRATRG